MDQWLVDNFAVVLLAAFSGHELLKHLLGSVKNVRILPRAVQPEKSRVKSSRAA